MRNLIWGVGTQFRSSGRATNALTCRPISPVLSFSLEIPIFPYVILFYLYPCFLNLCSAFFLLVLFWFHTYLWLFDLYFKIFLFKNFKLYILIMCFPLSNSSQIFLQLPIHPASHSLPSLSKRKKNVYLYTFKNTNY